MYEIIFYTNCRGRSELLDYIKIINEKAKSSKNDRITLKQIRFYINILENLGIKAGEPFVKHIHDKIWELRPGNNRILFFFWHENKVVLLHHFRKSTNKTPECELIKAISEINDWNRRNN